MKTVSLSLSLNAPLCVCVYKCERDKKSMCPCKCLANADTNFVSVVYYIFISFLFFSHIHIVIYIYLYIYMWIQYIYLTGWLGNGTINLDVSHAMHTRRTKLVCVFFITFLHKLNIFLIIDVSLTVVVRMRSSMHHQILWMNSRNSESNKNISGF